MGDYEVQQVRLTEPNHRTHYRQTDEANENVQQTIEPAMPTAEGLLRRERVEQEKASFQLQLVDRNI